MAFSLFDKYNVQAPRYTSYPTVPYWNLNPPNIATWSKHVQTAFQINNAKNGISLYIHLPYCESLCTYCGCNTRITVNHGVERPYLETVLKEWKLYLNLFDEKPRITEIHLGGGTPTFFSPDNLRFLLESILESGQKLSQKDCDYSFEAHPKNTTKEHLKTLYNLGFRRLSLGIQDFDPEVQRIINRIQTIEQVEETVQHARNLNYHSINFDLIYGLPKQSIKTIENTIQKVNLMRPERIAFYSYAHVPWIKPGQRSYSEKDLPNGKEKRALYQRGKELLLACGYNEIGMDHFALEEDPLSIAHTNKNMHRNFMGYTTSKSNLLIGLGVSSISDSWTHLAQNAKTVEGYTEKIKNGQLAIFKGHELSKEDQILRKHILNIICQGKTSWQGIDMQCKYLEDLHQRLKEVESDGFIVLEDQTLNVTPEGEAFLRNICMAFDAYLESKPIEGNTFSKAV